MKYTFENNTVHLFDNNHSNVLQPFWENTYIPFIDKDDGDKWVDSYLAKTHDAARICFNINWKHDNEVVTNNVLIADEVYTLLITEATKRLNGEYTIGFLVVSNGKETKITKDLLFVDGEASCEIMFQNIGTLDIELDDVFHIGSQKYLFVDDRTENSEFYKSVQTITRYIIEE